MNTEMRIDAEAFKESLKDKSKFHIIDPKDLLAPLASLKDDKGKTNYSDLLNYLSKRYW